MITTRIKVQSCREVADHRAWFDIAVSVAGQLSVDAANYKGSQLLAKRVLVDALTPSVQRATRGPVGDELPEIMVTAMRLDGVIETVPASQQLPVYLAHLAFYDPSSDELQVVEFVDEHDAGGEGTAQ